MFRGVSPSHVVTLEPTLKEYLEGKKKLSEILKLIQQYFDETVRHQTTELALITDPFVSEQIRSKYQNQLKTKKEQILKWLTDVHKELTRSLDPSQYILLKHRHERLEERISNLLSSYFIFHSSYTEIKEDITKPIALGQRDHELKLVGFDKFKADTAKLVTSTYIDFATDVKEYKSSPYHVLDSDTSFYTTDKNGRVVKFVTAIADGGASRDETYDLITAKLTHVLTFNGARLFQNCKTPEELKLVSKDILTELNNRAALIRGENDNYAALSIGVGFRSVAGFRFTGFSVGKTMFIAIDTATNTVRTIAPARFSHENTKLAIPFRGNLPKGVYSFDEELAPTEAVLGLTEGIHTLLLLLRFNPDEAHPYVQTCIDAKVFEQEVLKGIPPHSTAEVYVQAIQKAAFQKLSESHKQTCDAKDILDKANAEFESLPITKHLRKMRRCFDESKLNENADKPSALEKYKKELENYPDFFSLLENHKWRNIREADYAIDLVRNQFLKKLENQAQLEKFASRKQIGSDATITFIRFPESEFVSSLLQDLINKLAATVKCSSTKLFTTIPDNCARLLSLEPKSVDELCTILYVELLAQKEFNNDSTVALNRFFTEQPIAAAWKEINGVKVENDPLLKKAVSLLSFVNKSQLKDKTANLSLTPLAFLVHQLILQKDPKKIEKIMEQITGLAKHHMWKEVLDILSSNEKKAQPTLPKQ